VEWREEQLLEKFVTHPKDASTLQSDGTKIAPPEDLAPATADTEDNEPESETKSIEKCKCRQTRAKGKAKGSTVCFDYNTLILLTKTEKASWTPIWLTNKGDLVVQSLPSGDTNNLTDATTTAIKTVCTFDCPASGIDMIQLGLANITAHHHIQTPEGWMTARQATKWVTGHFWPSNYMREFSTYVWSEGEILSSTSLQTRTQ